MASWNVLITRKIVDEDAYKMTKALYEHKQDILNISTRLASMSPENLKYIRSSTRRREVLQRSAQLNKQSAKQVA